MNSDVVIVGGGVIGSAIAYFLAANSDFTGRVRVIERDPTYQECSTTRSAGSIRLQFSTPENIAISQFGIKFLRQLNEYLAVDDECADVHFIEGGYLFLATAQGVEALQQRIAIQHQLGAATRGLDQDQLRRRYPWLNVDDLAAGAWGEVDEGWFDPYALLQALRRKAIDLGVVYRTEEVTALKHKRQRILTVELGNGERLGCDQVVNAAGPRARQVAAMAGIELPVSPRKRYVFVFDCRTPITGCPLVIDPSGCYFRPEGKQFICGLSPPPHQDPDCLDLEVDYDYFDTRIWPLLAHRVPAFEAVKRTAAWAGHYAFNSFDQNAILGRHPDVSNLYFANGFSGHGLQQAPAVGRAISELMVYGSYRSLDLSRLSFERLFRGEPLREINVV